MFQDPRSQFFANEVAGEIAFGCENYGYTHEEIQSHVLQAAQYNKIEDLLDHSLHTLSYGMRQKVAIASAQAIEPEIYVMDEPSANLDIESTYRFGDIIRNLKAQGKTIVIAEPACTISWMLRTDFSVFSTVRLCESSQGKK